MLRSGLIEYAKAAWSRTCTRITKYPAATAKALKNSILSGEGGNRFAVAKMCRPIKILNKV
jgi:hypothetical protein